MNTSHRTVFVAFTVAAASFTGLVGRATASTSFPQSVDSVAVASKSTALARSYCGEWGYGGQMGHVKCDGLHKNVKAKVQCVNRENTVEYVTSKHWRWEYNNAECPKGYWVSEIWRLDDQPR